MNDLAETLGEVFVNSVGSTNDEDRMVLLLSHMSPLPSIHEYLWATHAGNIFGHSNGFESGGTTTLVISLVFISIRIYAVNLLWQIRFLLVKIHLIESEKYVCTTTT